jgi:hypothetical protein
MRRCPPITRKIVQMCALTHVATANLGDPTAQTLARLTHSYGRGSRKIDAFIIDEFSQIDAVLWCHLAGILHHSGAALIIAGDWAQLGPVCDYIGGKACPSMQGRAFLREKCSHFLRLTTCRRSDARLFDFYTMVADSSNTNLVYWVDQARTMFPRLPGHSPVNLVCSHRRRVSLNHALQEYYRPREGCIWVDPGQSKATHCHPQPMWLWVGQDLICSTIRKGLRRQWTYKIVELSDRDAVLEAPDGTRTERIAHQMVAQAFRLSFARTYHSSQGCEWPRVRLWDFDSTFLTKSHIVVGLSRCLNSAALDIM